MRRFAILLSLLPLTASAVPLELTHQGRLHDSAGLALTGPQDVRVVLWNDPSGGTELWSDDFTGVNFDEGFYSLLLGSGAALDTEVFEGDDIYLAITLNDGTELSPRHHVTSVPFAVRAQTATDVVGGVVDASEVRIDGNVVINSDGMIAWDVLSGVPADLGTDTLADLTCSPGQVAEYNGSVWGCASPAANNDASALTTGVLSPDVIPFGDQTTQVAKGDHRHGFDDIDGELGLDRTTGDLPIARVTGEVPYAQLPVGLESGKVMPGDTTIAQLGGVSASGGTVDGDLTVTGSFSAGTLDLTGALKVGTATTCNDAASGTLRFESQALQVCADGAWQDVYRTQPGSSAANAGASCQDILDGSPGASSGVYWINPTGSQAYEVYCDMVTNGGGWTLVMKANGSAFEFHSTAWDEANVVNQTSPDVSWVDAKYQAFNDLPATELLLVSQGGNNTQLTLPGTKPMLSWFQGPTVRLTHTGGSSTANHLVNSTTPTICGHPWRLNTGRASDDFPVRIGGYFSHQWSCGYGADDLGEPTGAESAGFGLRDDAWNPFTLNKRGFGIRQAHDYNTAPGGGQVSIGGAIYVR